MPQSWSPTTAEQFGFQQFRIACSPIIRIHVFINVSWC